MTEEIEKIEKLRAEYEAKKQYVVFPSQRESVQDKINVIDEILAILKGTE